MLAAGARQVLPHGVGADRQLAVAAVDEHREPHRARPAEVGERVDIPAELIPADAQVEIEAKKAAGYFTPAGAPDEEQLKQTKGRSL